MSSVTQLSRAQKAAAVLVAIGPEAASKIMAFLTDAEQEQVALEVATLGQVKAEDAGQILREFHAEAVAHQFILKGGVDFARDLLRRTHGSEADGIIERLLAAVSVSPFAFLRQRDPAQLVQYLQEEHPQTVALVLAHLPPGNAARVIAGLPEHVQREVAFRLATMESTSPEVIAQVETAMQTRFGSVRGREELSKKGGVKDLASILNSSDRQTERLILAGLEATDPDIAEEVRALMFVFEDIVLLDDRAVQEVLREIDASTLALAMKGVTDTVSDKILSNVSQRAAEALREELEVLGAVRVRDVEAAQSEIVRHIRRLEEDGRIIVKRGGEGGDVIE
ncbi:MAG TPA: flagellar motor switch protein FliG [Egibacteraceae bacterium]|nr:flagellar motor switch protein FliG [Egibacteraceae bacterium]